jgi:hypothetical protein
MIHSPEHEPHSPEPAVPGRAARPRKMLQLTAILLLVVVAGSGGALYHVWYGDRTSTDFNRIVAVTKDLMKVQVPPRLWPRLLVERPDVMTMVVYATKNDDACLALLRCVPGRKGDPTNLPDRLLQSVLVQYCPQFDTERWTDVEQRQISVQGASQDVKIASSLRTDDHHEVRVVSLDNVPTEQGAVSLYFQSTVESSTDDEIDILLQSLK